MLHKHQGEEGEGGEEEETGKTAIESISHQANKEEHIPNTTTKVAAKGEEGRKMINNQRAQQKEEMDMEEVRRPITPEDPSTQKDVKEKSFLRMIRSKRNIDKDAAGNTKTEVGFLKRSQDGSYQNFYQDQEGYKEEYKDDAHSQTEEKAPKEQAVEEL